MPKNCCVPRCKSNSSKTPDVCYHEFPAKEQLRDAWLHNISRQGIDKGREWKPSSRSVVCSLHFKEDDYKVGLKRKLLLPTAVPTRFPSYPTYMQPGSPKRRRALVRPLLEAGASTSQASNQEQMSTMVAENETNQTENEERHQLMPPNSPTEADPILYALADLQSSGQRSYGTQECQTSFDLTGFIDDTKRNARRLQMQANRLNEKLQKLQERCDEFREQVKKFEEDRAVHSVVKIRDAAKEGEKSARFLLEQVENFAKARPTWQETTVRECVLWKACSRKGYDHVRSRNLLNLPCRSTLQRFVGSSTGETGVTRLIRERLQTERQGFRSDNEAYCSLIVDEMSVQQKLIYDRQVDRIFGLIDAQCEGPARASEVANRLLCFVLRGLSTAYVIPAGYFFTKNLKHDCKGPRR